MLHHANYTTGLEQGVGVRQGLRAKAALVLEPAKVVKSPNK